MSGSTASDTPRRQREIPGVDSPADQHALDVHLDAGRDVRGLGLDGYLDELLV